MIAFFSFDFLGTKLFARIFGGQEATSFHFYNGRLNFVFIFSLFFQNPLIGYGSFMPIENYVALEFIVQRFSVWNGYFAYLLYYGILIFGIFNYLLFQFCRYINKGKIDFWTIKFLLIIIILLNASNHAVMPTFYFLPLWGLLLKSDYILEKNPK